MFTVKTTGMEEVRKALAAFTTEMQEKIIDKGLDNAADYVAVIARKEAPTSDKVHFQYYGGKKVEVRPGNLKRSIARIPRIRGSKNKKIRLTGPRAGKKYKNDGWYGHMVNQGTVHSRANPFQERAASQAENGIMNIIEDGVSKAIRKLNN